jgi:hypothetical protein
MQQTPYRDVVIETYRNRGEPSRAKIRARPVPGQGLSPNMKVECSSSMRERHPVGTKFIVQCKVTDREGGAEFLYTSFYWDFRVVTDVQAKAFIHEHHGPSPLGAAGR